MATRAYRTARTHQNLEATFDGDRQRIDRAALAIAQADRTADGIAPIEPSVLMATFRTEPASAWAMLALLTEEQLIIQAIDTACWLEETQGIEMAYGEIRQRWQVKLAEIATTAQAEAEALTALLEAAQAHTTAVTVATSPEDYAAAAATHTAATDVYFEVRAKRELLTASTFPEITQCTACGTVLAHPHGGLCRQCYTDGHIGYYIPVWLAPDLPLVNGLGNPLPASNAEHIARQLIHELNQYETLDLPCDARYDAKSAQVRELGFDIGPDKNGRLCLYDPQTQRPVVTAPVTLLGYTVDSIAVELCPACASKTPNACKWSGECVNGYCDMCGAGPSVPHFPLPDPVALDHPTKPLKAPPVPDYPHRNRVGIELCVACRTREATIIDAVSGDALCPRCWGLDDGRAGSKIPANPTPPQLPPGVMLVNNKVITGQIIADKLYTDRSTRRELMHLFDEMTQDQRREAILLLIRQRQQQERRRATLPAVLVVA